MKLAKNLYFVMSKKKLMSSYKILGCKSVLRGEGWGINDVLCTFANNVYVYELSRIFCQMC